MSNPGRSVFQLADKVIDSVPVDWEGARQKAEDLEERELIRALYEISCIASAHQRPEELDDVDQPRQRPIPIVSLLDTPHERTAPPASPRLSYAPGQAFGPRYTIIDHVGQGGMGVVYKAHDRELDCTVALKMIREDQAHNPETLARFRRELRLGQQVTHENVCRLYDLGEVEGVPYLSMEFLQGHTLAALIGEMGGLSPRQTFDIANDVCAGLEAIHGEHIVHRDLKPSNVAVTTAGRTVVLDLGIARRSLDLDVTEPGVVVGSYAYIAPEQVEAGPIDQRTDIYALGLLLFEMLTGRRAPGDGGGTVSASRSGLRVSAAERLAPRLVARARRAHLELCGLGAREAS